jgi:hypothetical protein
MGTAQRLRVDDVSGGGTPAPLVGGASGSPRFRFMGNMGHGDVRGDSARTQVITLGAFAGTDSFKVRVRALADAGAAAATDTAAFVRGTNAAASDLQTALRTATGDTGLTVAGDTDEGPFTVTFVNKKGFPLFELVTLSACSGNVQKGVLTYDDVPQTGTVGTVPTTNGVAFDQESSKGFGADVPLGHSVDTRGTGQTRGVELLPPTVVSALGGVGQVVIDTTEVSSGGTSAVVLTSIRNINTGAWVVVDNEDADGDQTISGLTAGDYAAYFHTQTAGGQVSRPSAPEYFTVT